MVGGQHRQCDTNEAHEVMPMSQAVTVVT